MHRVISEIDVLEKVNAQLKSRIDDYLTVIKVAEEKMAEIEVSIDDSKIAFDMEKLKFERKPAAF